VYLYASFGNDNPLMSVIDLFKSSIMMQVFIALVVLHFLMKGVYEVITGWRKHIASAGLFISIGIIIAGVAVSMNIRETETKKVVMSEKVGSLSIQDIKMILPEKVLMVGESSDFNPGGIEVLAKEKGNNVVLKPFPFLWTSKGYAYVNDAGLSPTMKIHVDGNIYNLDKMQLLPPGKDFIAHMGIGVQTVISMKHGREFMKGRLSAREYDLSSPGYNILIKKDNKVIFDETIDTEGRQIKGDISIDVGRTETWAEIAFVRDMTVYVLYAGLAGFIIFVLLYPLEVYWRF
jgi:hypothetical protein